MPYTVHLVDGGRGSVYLCRGIVAADEIFTMARDANLAPEITSQLGYSLVDFTDATELQISGPEVRDVVSENEVTATITPPGVIAVVAPRDQIYGIARMWAVYVEKLDWKVGVFRVREEAVEWLQSRIPAAKLEPFTPPAAVIP